MPPKVILTGAGGFVGRAVFERLREAGWGIVPLVRRKQGLDGEVVLDFTSADALTQLRALPRVDAVIHLASHVDFSPDAPVADFFATNVLAPAGLAQRVTEWGAHFVFCSATLVYGPREHVDASTPVNPSVPYGRAKRLAEMILEATGGRVTILRIGGIFGRRGPNHLGLNAAIDAALDEGRPPVLRGSGSARRNYIYVEDLADIISDVVDQEKTGTYLVAGQDVLTVRQMLEAICREFLGGGSPIHEAGTEALDAIVEPAPHLLAGRSFEEALRDIKLREIRQLGSSAE